jgi:phenylacetate-CoA ligase
MCGAEPWTNAMRAEIEEAFDLHAIDNYGLSEIIGPGVSCECIESKDGPHIWEDHFYPEVIDPVTGKILYQGGDADRSVSHARPVASAAWHRAFNA